VGITGKPKGERNGNVGEEEEEDEATVAAEEEEGKKGSRASPQHQNLSLLPLNSRQALSRYWGTQEQDHTPVE